MKIAIAGGHSRKAQGAVGYLNEYECDRAYVAQLIPALRAAGHTVIDCSNEMGNQNAELSEEVRLANASGADLFLAVHFNAGGGIGTECYYHASDEDARPIAARMSVNVAGALGLRDRGAKTADFYVLRSTKMRALLLEVCFVDSKADADAWHRTSWAKLTKAVVDAIGGASSAPAKPSDAPQVTGSTERTGTGFGGTYRCTVDALNVRTAPSLSGKVVAKYGKGQTVILDDWYAIADGWVWGRYTGAQSGQLRYVAVGKPTGGPAADDYLVRV